MSVIIVKLDNVHRDEQETLKEYLESKCWDWKEIEKEDDELATEPAKPKTTKEYFDECLLRWGGSVKRK